MTSFAPAYITSLNYAMSFAGIFVNKSFTFSVSDLTIFQSWFRREDNAVFFPDMILLMGSILAFSSWGSVCVCVLAVHGSLSCSLVWSLWLSGIYCLVYCVCGLLICLPIHLLVNFQYFRVRKPIILGYCPNLVRGPLVCCLKSTEFY